METKMDVRQWTVIVPKTDIGIHTVLLRDLIRKQELWIYFLKLFLERQGERMIR